MLICPACNRRYRSGHDHCSEDGTQLVPSNAPPSLQPGIALEGGPVIHQFLGSGPTGEIYAADHKGRTVTVKLLSPELASDQAYCKHLSRLLGHLAKVRHPGVAATLSHSLALHQGRPWLALESVSGRTLSDVVRRTGPLPPQRALPIAQHIAEALTEAHRAGALHLNLKPSNVFLDANEAIKLVDFGLGARLEVNGKIVHGDPRFMAPEQFEGKLVSFRSDIYGVGALLFYLLTARPPFHGSGEEAARAVTSQTVPPPSTLEPALAGQTKLDQIVQRALEKMPAKRYLSVQHFGRMMDGLVQVSGRAGAAPGAAPPASRTLPLGGQAMTPQNRGVGAPPVPGVPRQPPGFDDTVRMQLPPERPSAEHEPPTIRDSNPRGMAAQTVETPMQIPPQAAGGAAPNAHQNHGTLRMAVPPVPQRPADTQPIEVTPPPSPPPQQAHATIPMPVPPQMSGDQGLEIVEAKKVPPRPKRKKRKKKKRAPIVAVRGEAALRLGPTGAQAGDGDDGDAVMLDSGFMEEARGPERNLQTMEIRVTPEMGLEMAGKSESSPKKKKSSLGKWVLAGVALIILFVIAAVGAAGLARLLSPPPPPEPVPQSAPVLEQPAPLPPGSPPAQ